MNDINVLLPVLFVLWVLVRRTSQRCSDEYQHHMFLSRNKKKILHGHPFFYGAVVLWCPFIRGKYGSSAVFHVLGPVVQNLLVNMTLKFLSLNMASTLIFFC